MADLRDAFLDISSGWMLIDSYDDITDRIERLAALTKSLGGVEALTDDERATVRYLIEVQFVRAAREGIGERFDPVLIPGVS